MSINESIWGTPENYRAYEHGSDIIVDIKLPQTNKNSFYKTYGYTAPENIDLSISPWGIGGGSWLCHTYGVACWIQNAGDANPYDRENGFNIIHYDFDKYSALQHPMILYSAYSDSNAFLTPTEDSGKMPNTYRYFPQPSEDAASYSGQRPLTTSSVYSGWRRTPIVSFIYKNMILIPYIIGIAKNSGANVVTMYLDDFCNNTENTATTDNIAGWRANDVHIIGIGYMFANGNPGNRNLSDDTSNLYCIGTQRELNSYTPPEPLYIDNLPPAAGNYPTQAKHIVMSGYTGQYSSAYHYSTCITSACNIRAWDDINSSPLNYWYGQYYVDGGLTYQTASAYFTGGEDWKPACYVPGSEVPPTNGSTPKRYMYWDITSISDDDVKAELWRQVAFLGFCFTTDHTKYNGTVGENIELCMPVFDSTGCTTGEYKIGLDCKTLPNYQWTDDAWEKNRSYDPNQHAGNDEDYGDLKNLGTYTHFPASLRVLEISLDKMLDTITVLNQLYVNDTSGVEKWELNFKGANPSDYIVGLYGTVVNLAHVSDTPTPIKISDVYLTDYDPTLQGYAVDTTNTGRFSCGSVNIPEYFGDFRDYSPYTTIELYLPLCGTVELDPAFVVGHSVHVVYYIDVLTMSCTAAVYRDGITLIKTVDGVCGASIPLTAARMGDYQNQVHALETAHKQNEIRIATSAISVAAGAAALLAAPATGGASLIAGAGILSGIGGVMSNINADTENRYQLEHTKPAVSQTGAAEAQNAFSFGSMYPFIFIKRAKMLSGYDKQMYSHTIGNACCENQLIGDMQGFTVASNIDTSGISATIEEINLIKQSFNNGVYV